SALAPLWQPSGRHDAPARPMHADAGIPIPSRKCFLALRSFPATTARREGGVPRNTHPRVCRPRALTLHEGTPADSGSALSRRVLRVQACPPASPAALCRMFFSPGRVPLSVTASRVLSDYSPARRMAGAPPDPEPPVFWHDKRGYSHSTTDELLHRVIRRSGI